MIFTTLPQVANHIKKHHYLFGGRFVKETLSILGEMNAYIKANHGTGASFEAWQLVPDTYTHLKTLVTINRCDTGWMVTESVIEKRD